MLSQDLSNLAGALNVLRADDGSLTLDDEDATALVAMIGTAAETAAALEGAAVATPSPPPVRLVVDNTVAGSAAP